MKINFNPEFSSLSLSEAVTLVETPFVDLESRVDVDAVTIDSPKAKILEDALWTDGHYLHVTFPDITGVLPQQSHLNRELKERGLRTFTRKGQELMPDCLAQHLSLRHETFRPTWTLEFNARLLPKAEAFCGGYMSKYRNRKPLNFQELSAQYATGRLDADIGRLLNVARELPSIWGRDLIDSDTKEVEGRELVMRLKYLAQVSVGRALRKENIPVIYSNQIMAPKWGELTHMTRFSLEPDDRVEPSLMPLSNCLRSYAAITNQRVFRTIIDDSYPGQYSPQQLQEIVGHLNTKQIAWDVLKEGLCSSGLSKIGGDIERLETVYTNGFSHLEVSEFSQLLSTAIGNRRIGSSLSREVIRRVQADELPYNLVGQILQLNSYRGPTSELKNELSMRIHEDSALGAYLVNFMS